MKPLLLAAALVSLSSLLAAPVSAQQPPSWTQPTEPVHIAGPIWFVGTVGLAGYLFATPQGHVLLDGGMPGSEALFEASIRKAGFDPKDVKVLLTTQAHCDHVGTH